MEGTPEQWGGRYGQDVPYGSGRGRDQGRSRLPASPGARDAVPYEAGIMPGPGTKRCPRCGAVLFDDMEVCYACLYDFSKDRAAQRRAQMPSMPGDPELTTADVVGLVDGWAGSVSEAQDASVDDGCLWGSSSRRRTRTTPGRTCLTRRSFPWDNGRKKPGSRTSSCHRPLHPSAPRMPAMIGLLRRPIRRRPCRGSGP